ncbi:MAG: TRAP transporter fused permease subunit [Peptococcaceae bacterium]|jgi:TRAP transporter 4TM/12TM fusion protein|nr:TRAP transporter fused permease subunit [Peptococcaceae bacterium]MDH7523908.1 TRAP transporter fused permease subunit [Peptococcaceae bacterium]
MARISNNQAKTIITILSCSLTVFTILFALTFFCTSAKFTATILPIALIVTLLNLYYNEKKIKHNRLITIIIWTISLIMFISAVYYWMEIYEMMQFRVSNYTTLDYFFIYITIPLVIYLAFKTLGVIFGIVICSPFLLVAFGQYLPQPFTIGKIGFVRFVASISLDLAGIWGPLTQAMATYVGIFVIFAAVVRGFGGLESMIAFFIRLLGKHEVFFPQVATVSSMMFGSFSGSAIANVAGTGTFTIPMMKMRGMKPEDAASVETVASTGGAIMPPIMGAAAFIMAELLGTSYLNIIAAGILPALVFYFTTFLNTHWIRLRQMRKEALGLVKKDEQLIEKQMKEMEKLYDPLILWCILASIIVLMYYLLTGASILVAGVNTIVSFYIFYLLKLFIPLLVSYIKNPQGGDVWAKSKENLKGFIKGGINALNEAGKSVSEVILLGAALGIISSTLLRTGLLYKLGAELVRVAHGEPYLLLLVTVVLCVLLGMAVSGLATYLLVASIVVIAFRQIGIDPLTAHFIVFYGSALAPITPPIAPACAIAAKLAQGSFVKSAVTSLKMAQGLILMPLVFLNFPSILRLDYVVFLFMLSAMFLISMGLFVEFRGMKKIPNILLVALGLSMMVYQYPLHVNIVLSAAAFLLVVAGIRKLGVFKFKDISEKKEL